MLDYLDTATLVRIPQYNVIKDIIRTLDNCGTSKSFPGNCIAACDIFQNISSRLGLKTRIVECQATITTVNHLGQQNFMFIGFDHSAFDDQIDTHTILVIDAEVPILVDLSLGNVLPANRPYVICEATPTNDSFAEVSYGNVNIKYQEKKNIRLPQVHQKNLLQRFIAEQKISKTVEHLKVFVMCAVGLGLLNFCLNVIMIVLRLFDITLTD